jgi:hypothetical protein
MRVDLFCSQKFSRLPRFSDVKNVETSKWNHHSNVTVIEMEPFALPVKQMIPIIEDVCSSTKLKFLLSIVRVYNHVLCVCCIFKP